MCDTLAPSQKKPYSDAYASDVLWCIPYHSECVTVVHQLIAIPTDILPFIIQTIYVCTGCDYISFFSQIVKTTFLRYFFQYASFITSGNPEGTLADTVLEDNIFETGYLAFLRLVGTVYFKKYATAFKMQSPATHFIQFCTATHSIRQQHTAWLEDIRNNIWDRIPFENEMVPSDDALYLHWRRSCWVLHMHIILPILSSPGA